MVERPCCLLDGRLLGLLVFAQRGEITDGVLVWRRLRRCVRGQGDDAAWPRAVTVLNDHVAIDEQIVTEPLMVARGGRAIGPRPPDVRLMTRPGLVDEDVEL